MISGTIQREHEDAVGEISHSYANEGRREARLSTKAHLCDRETGWRGMALI